MVPFAVKANTAVTMRRIAWAVRRLGAEPRCIFLVRPRKRCVIAPHSRKVMRDTISI